MTSRNVPEFVGSLRANGASTSSYAAQAAGSYEPPVADQANPNLHPLLLRFPDEDVERTFEEEFGRTRASNDKRNWVLGFSILVFLLLWKESGPGKELLPCVLLSLLHGLSISMMAARNCFRRRSVVVIAIRVVNDAIVAACIIRWTKPTSSRGALLKHMFGTSCIVNLLYESVSHCVPLKFAVIAQGVSLYMFSSQSTSSSCEMILASDGGHELIQQLWAVLRKFCELATWMGRVQVLDADSLAAISSQPQLACMSTVRLLQGVLGYLLPMTGMFWMERNERLRFWAQTTGHSLRDVHAKARISIFSKVAAAALLLVGFLGIWEASIVHCYSAFLPLANA